MQMFIAMSGRSGSKLLVSDLHQHGTIIKTPLVYPAVFQRCDNSVALFLQDQFLLGAHWCSGFWNGQAKSTVSS